MSVQLVEIESGPAGTTIWRALVLLALWRIAELLAQILEALQ